MRDETQEVSLCDTLPASESIVAALANVREPTIDISPQELSVAAARVANDVRAPGAADESTMSIPVRVPGARSRAWLWAALALPMLLVAAVVGFELLPLAEFRTQPAFHSEPASADRHQEASPSTAAHHELEVPRAPEANSAPAQEPPSAQAETPAGASENAVAADQAALDQASQAARARADQLAAQGNALRKRRKLGPARSKYRAALEVFPGHPVALDGLTQLDGLARKRLKRPRR